DDSEADDSEADDSEVDGSAEADGSATGEDAAGTSDAEGSSAAYDAEESPDAEDAADGDVTEVAPADNDSTENEDATRDDVNDVLDLVGVAERAEAPPPLPRRRPIGDYRIRDLAALVRWLEADGKPRDESDVVALLRGHLDLADDARTIDVAVHAVRVARAGAPPYRASLS